MFALWKLFGWLVLTFAGLVSLLAAYFIPIVCYSYAEKSAAMMEGDLRNEKLSPEERVARAVRSPNKIVDQTKILAVTSSLFAVTTGLLLFATAHSVLKAERKNLTDEPGGP